MHDINTADQLEERIAVLEKKRKEEWRVVKDQLLGQYEKFTPAHFIRSTFQSITSSIGITSDLLQAGTALAAGIVVKSLLGRTKGNRFKKGLKVALVYAITTIISKHREAIIASAMNLVRYVTKGHAQPEEPPEPLDDENTGAARDAEQGLDSVLSRGTTESSRQS